jgi:hypothetical protein
MVTTISIKLGNDVIFQYNPDFNSIVFLTEYYKEELHEVFKMSGMYELYFEFTPNNTVKVTSDKNYLYPGNANSFTKKSSSSERYAEWFESIFNSFSGNIILIPDTNFLLKCYYSNYLERVVEKNKNKVSFALSRLTLLEMERQINDLTNKIEGDRKSLKKVTDADKIREIEGLLIDRRRRKRLRLQAIGEVAEIIRQGGEVIQPADDSMLRSFPKASGGSFADSWIRMELRSYEKEMLEKSNTSMIFVTGDLLNGLMAVAENINTVYTYSTDKPGLRNMNRLLYTIANAYEECEIVIKTNSSDEEEKYSLRSVWEGKTVEEWSNKKVELTKL